MITKNNEKELVKHVIASDHRERRNRTIGAIQRLCDYDVANAPRNDGNSGIIQNQLNVKFM